MSTYICATRNWQLFFILRQWNYFKCKNLLQTLNVFEIPAQEHHLVDCLAADEISVL